MEDRVESSSPRHAIPDRQEDVLERNRAETFNERLRRRWQEARTLLCVGLDGEIERMPEQFRRGLAPGETNGNGADERERRIEAALTEYHIAIVEATADLVCAYKPNIAFYEQHGPAGLRALIAVIAYIQKKYPEIPVLLDAKRGDIGSTSQAYAARVVRCLRRRRGHSAALPGLRRAGAVPRSRGSRRLHPLPHLESRRQRATGSLCANRRERS